MKSRSRKRLTAGERRKKILAAAVRLFARKGYDGAAMEEIAGQAGITKPVLYDHFRSKQALFRAVLESIRDELLARGRSVAESPLELEAKFRASLDAFFEFVDERPEATRVLLTIPRSDPIAAKLSRDVQAGASAGIAKFLAVYLPASEPWRLQATTEFLKAGLHALAEWWLESPRLARADLLDVVMRCSWYGLEAKR